MRACGRRTGPGCLTGAVRVRRGSPGLPSKTPAGCRGTGHSTRPSPRQSAPAGSRRVRCPRARRSTSAPSTPGPVGWPKAVVRRDRTRPLAARALWRDRSGSLPRRRIGATPLRNPSPAGRRPAGPGQGHCQCRRRRRSGPARPTSAGSIRRCRGRAGTGSVRGRRPRRCGSGPRRAPCRSRPPPGPLSPAAPRPSPPAPGADRGRKGRWDYSPSSWSGRAAAGAVRRSMLSRASAPPRSPPAA